MIQRLTVARPPVESVKVVVVIDNAAGPVSQKIQHKLGKVPRYWSVVDESIGGSVFRSEGSRWTAQEIELTFPFAGRWVIQLS